MTIATTFRILAIYAAITASIAQVIAWILARDLALASSSLHTIAAYGFAVFVGLALLSILIQLSPSATSQTGSSSGASDSGQ